MSEEKHREMTRGFWGKLLSVILIPCVVYYCSTRSSKPNKDTSPRITTPNPVSPSSADEIRNNVNDLITRDRELQIPDSLY